MFDGREEKPVEGYADTLFTDRALTFIEKHKKDPFFLYLPYIASHGVIEARADDIEMFKGKFKEKDPEKPLLATYAAMVYRLDQEIGRILALLDKLDLKQNTLIIFTSDHGATFEKIEQGTTNYFDSNRPFRGQKRTLWEGGIRVPAVVRWPGKVPAKKDSYEIIHACDLFPTVLAAAGASTEASANLDGKNVLDVLQGKAESPERTLFWEWREGGDTQFVASPATTSRSCSTWPPTPRNAAPSTRSTPTTSRR
jgi:arylsulfatase A-like enzyme